MSRSNDFIDSYFKGLFPILGVTCICFGLIMLQPDLGTGVIVFMSIISILFIAGVSMKFFMAGGVIGLICVIGLIAIAPYRMSRITAFIDPWKDELGSGFQMIQSLYAIGPGGVLGTGFLNSIQKHFYLPEPQTDFIFSIISEEFGFLGVLVVTAIFLVIFIRAVKISLSSKDLFSKYLVFGLAFGILIQALLNLCVVVGLIPVTGVTLPFFSYGGSSLLVSLASIGIILNVSRK